MQINEPIRVLHILGSLARGGTQAMVMSWYRAMDRSKVQFDFIVYAEDKNDHEEEILSMGGRVHVLPPPRGHSPLYMRKTWEKFLNDHTEYRILHDCGFEWAIFNYPIIKRHGIFLITHSHNTHEKEVSVKAAVRRITRIPARRLPNMFFGCSMQACIDKFGRRIASDRTRCKVIKNAINTALFAYNRQAREAIRDEFGIQDRFVVGAVGRITEQKNPDGIINIFKKVYEREPGTVLLWAGTGDMEGRIKDRVEREGLGGHVVFTGVRTDIPALLSAMDVFLLPSLYEGLSVAIVEAQASGLPCVASEASANEANILKELVHIVPLREPPEKWAEAILRCVEKERLENCYERVAEEGFDIYKNAKWLQEFYLKTVKAI